MRWIRDEEFICGKVPLTKFNIRVLTMAYLSIEKGDRLLDIGAGTGSISIEASLQGARVWAIEKSKEAIDIIKENKSKFNVNLDLIHGEAPDALPNIKFNKCFLGGSDGRLENIFEYLKDHLELEGILCANFVTLKNLNHFLQLLKDYGYIDVEIQLIQSSYMDHMGLMRGNNPIFIVKGVKR